MAEPATCQVRPADRYSPMRRVRRVHFVGIGGAGMGGIAEVLHTLGFEVTGSDLVTGMMTARLPALIAAGASERDLVEVLSGDGEKAGALLSGYTNIGDEAKAYLKSIIR